MSDRRFAEVPIYKGSDLAKLAELDRAAKVAERHYQEALKSSTSRMGDDESPQAAKDAYDAYVAEAAERAQFVRLEALGRRQWRDLLAAHAPRRVKRLVAGSQSEVVHDADEDLGVNTETFPEALLTYVNPTREDMRTIADPKFATTGDCVDWLDDLSGGDFDRLFLTAYNLNGSVGYDPKETTYGDSPSLSTTDG